MKKVWFILAMMISVFASCSDGGSDNPVNPTPKPEEVKTEITIDSGIVSNGLSFGATEGEQSISISVNANWTLSVASTTSGVTWCKASATSGSKGSATVKFTVDENTGYDDRSVSVTIKAGSVSKTFTITQKGADALLVTTTKYEVAQEGGQIEIEVKTNISYQMEIAENAKSWITEVESKGRALTTNKHKLDITMNEDTEKREGEITFKSGDKVETVKVYQAGGAILLLSQNEYIVSDVGETISVDIKSNIDFGVQMPDVDWISDEASSRGMSSHTLKYIVSANEEYDSRSAEIVFYDKNSDLKDTLKVVQAQKDAIILSEKEYYLEQVGGNIEVKVKANIQYEIVIPENSKNWITESSSRTLIDNKHNFIIYSNNESKDRLGEISFKNGNILQSIQIHQKGGPILKLSNKYYSVGYKGDTIHVYLESNVNFSIKMPGENWITNYTDNRGLSKQTFKYIIEPNNNSEKRNTEIIYYDENSNISDTLYISQSPRTNIILSEKNITTNWVGKSLNVKINENIEYPYIVEMPKDEWIHCTNKSRGSVEFSIDYNNKTNSSRSTSVIFMSKDKEIVDTLNITQRAKGGNLNGYLRGKYGESYSYLDSITIDIPMNAEDMMLLKSLMSNHLNYLDISKSTIIEETYRVPNSHKKYWTYDDIVNNFDYCSKIKTVILPNSAQKIAQEAFIGSEILEEVIFGSGIHTIGDNAFKNCYNLKKVNFPDNIVTLGKNLFVGCKLEKVNLGNKIETIGNYAFCNSRLREINIPDNVISIGEAAFGECWGLTVKLSENLRHIGDAAFSGCSMSELILPEKVTTIGNSSFSYNDFVEISIPNSVISIGKDAFYRCQKLERVKLGNGITHISNGMFSNCYNLESIIIPDNITSIGANAFIECKKLNSIIIPDSITTIGSQAFMNCTTLEYIKLDNIQHIDNRAFYNCMSFKEDLKLNNITSLGDYAFSGCKSLINIEIGNEIIIIPADTFRGCKNLKKVVLGENIIEIGKGAFSDTIIESFYIKSPNPPKVNGAFDYSWSWGQDSYRILYVPKGSLELYYSSEWPNYFDGIKEMDEI